jgi:ABC-2 type transport system permease protein
MLEQQVLAEHGVDSLHKLPFNFDAYRMQKGEEHEAEIYAKHYKYLKEQYSKQSSLYQSLAIISPYLPTRFLSMAIARTDYSAHWDFSDAAEDYRIATQKFLNDNFAQNSSYGEWDYRANANFWGKLPEFSYNPQELNAILTTNASSLWILGAWILLSFGAFLITTKSI